jgi:hypothetical protein
VEDESGEDAGNEVGARGAYVPTRSVAFFSGGSELTVPSPYMSTPRCSDSCRSAASEIVPGERRNLSRRVPLGRACMRIQFLTLSMLQTLDTKGEQKTGEVRHLYSIVRPSEADKVFVTKTACLQLMTPTYAGASCVLVIDQLLQEKNQINDQDNRTSLARRLPFTRWMYRGLGHSRRVC